MPAKTLWLLHIPEIVSQLETFDAPVVDRAIIERLLGFAAPAGYRTAASVRRLSDRPDFPGRPALADRVSAASGRWGRIPAGKPPQRTFGARRRSTSPGSDGGAGEDPRVARCVPPETEVTGSWDSRGGFFKFAETSFGSALPRRKRIWEVVREVFQFAENLPANLAPQGEAGYG
jgi:hypothetical protein